MDHIGIIKRKNAWLEEVKFPFPTNVTAPSQNCPLANCRGQFPLLAAAANRMVISHSGRNRAEEQTDDRNGQESRIGTKQLGNVPVTRFNINTARPVIWAQATSTKNVE